MVFVFNFNTADEIMNIVLIFSYYAAINGKKCIASCPIKIYPKYPLPISNYKDPVLEVFPVRILWHAL